MGRSRRPGGRSLTSEAAAGGFQSGECSLVLTGAGSSKSAANKADSMSAGVAAAS